MADTEKNIGALVREMEQDYTNGTTVSSKYVQGNMYEDLATIDAYLNSKHISGEKDSQDREKPFYNICTAAVNIWYRATDIDRKDIVFKATKPSDYLLSFVATAKLQEFMRKEQFGRFLNDWGLALARYGSAVLEFIENSEGLHMSVLSWNNIIVDPIDFKANPLIKILYMTPAQLRQKEHYDQEVVEALIDSASEARETLDKRNKDNKDNYIKVYEVHGEIEKSYLTDKMKDDNEYVQQVHIFSYLEGKKSGEYDDYVLYRGKEKKSPHMITHLIEEPGQTLSIGAVKNLFQAQWMVNHSVKNEKDTLDLISKVILQTADTNFANKNVLSDIQDGFIAITQKDMPLAQVDFNSNGVTAMQNFGAQWMALAQEINHTPDVMQGKSLPSGTAYRQAAILQQESHSNFEMMVENKGLYIEEMMREHIIPYLKKQLDTKDEIVATLEGYGIEEIDRVFIPAEAAKRFNRKAVQAVLNRDELPDYNTELQQVTQELQTGVRYFKPSEADDKTWKDIFKDFDWDSLEVEVTGEQSDKQAILTTLSQVYQTIAQNPAILQDPNMKALFNEILNTAGGISPIQFKKPAMPVAQPQMVESVAGQNTQIQ